MWLLFSGCQPAPESDADPTLQFINNSFSFTATARHQPGSGFPLTLTPEVNSTNSALPDATLPPASITMPAATTDKATLGQIMDELPSYHVDPAAGKLGWIHPTAILSSDQSQQAIFRYEFPSVLGSDFVIAANITIQSSDLASGCGFSLRVHGEPSALNQYIVMLTRLPYGHLQFTALSQGEPANLREIYISDLDPLFSWEAGDTNRLAVIGQGSTLTVYSNFSPLGDIDVTQPPSLEQNMPPTPVPLLPQASAQEIAQFELVQNSYTQVVQALEIRYASIERLFQEKEPLFTQGYMGFSVINHTGTTECTFSQAWLWITKP